MVCNERDEHRVAVRAGNRGEVFFDILRQLADVARFCRDGEQTAGLRGREIKTVGGGVIPVGDAVPVPDFRDRVHIGIFGAERVEIFLPVGDACVVVSVIYVLRRIETEAVDAAVEVVSRNFQALFTHGGIFKVELRHAAVEIAFIIDIRAGKRGERASRRCGLALLVIAVEIIERIGRIVVSVRTCKVSEPFVRSCGMVDRQIEDQLDAARVAQRDQLIQILLRAELRIDLVIIGNVIFMIGRRGKNRRQPDPFDAEGFSGIRIAVVQVIHTVDDAPKIADAVVVGIGERADKDLVEDPCVVRRGNGTQKILIGDNVFALRRRFRLLRRFRFLRRFRSCSNSRRGGFRCGIHFLNAAETQRKQHGHEQCADGFLYGFHRITSPSCIESFITIVYFL